MTGRSQIRKPSKALILYSILKRSTTLCFSRFRKQRYGIRTAVTKRIGVQIPSGSSVKWKVENSLAVMARTTIPTARALTI